MSDHGEDLVEALLRILRTLSTSESGEEERNKLEIQFRKSTIKMDQLVLHNQKELSSVMEIFALVSSRLKSSQSQIGSVKSNLHSCRQLLLHYKRHEVRQLWLEQVEHDFALQILEKVEYVKSSADELGGLIENGQFLKATNILVKSSKLIAEELKSIEGLKDIRDTLVLQRKDLVTALESNLCHIIFKKISTLPESVLLGKMFKDSESAKNYLDSNSRWAKFRILNSIEESHFMKCIENPIRTENEYEMSEVFSSKKSGPHDISPDSNDTQNGTELSNHISPLQSMQAVVIYVECLSLLQELPRVIQNIKSDLQFELQQAVNDGSSLILSQSSVDPQISCVLARLFDLIVCHFFRISDIFKLFSIAANASIQRNNNGNDIVIWAPSIQEVWDKVQIVIQFFLGEYLDFSSNPVILETHASSKFLHYPYDINTCFAKRKQKKIKGSHSLMFRFESNNISNSPLISSSFPKQESGLVAKSIDGTKRSNRLVCPSNPYNLVKLYPLLIDFMKITESNLAEISTNTGKTPVPCLLRNYLMEYFREVFLIQVHGDNENILKLASDSLEGWATVTDSDVVNKLGLNRPLLKCCVDVNVAINNMIELMKSLPLFSEYFLTIISSLAKQFRELCRIAYRSCLQLDNSEKRIMSAQWIKDEDISRFLKSLPSWLSIVKKEQLTEKIMNNGFSSNTIDKAEEDSIELRNAKCTSILMGNLGESKISANEIILDENQLKQLALLHEAMVWFSSLMIEKSAEFSVKGKFDGEDSFVQSSIQTLVSLSDEFEELANTCLLVLHLEIRIHCFYFTYPMWEENTEPQFFCDQNFDPKPEVEMLIRDLVTLEVVLSRVLDDRKLLYIFEGISHLIGAILMGAVSSIIRINSNGVRKMCRTIFNIQHGISSRKFMSQNSSAFDLARSYYELLNLKPQEIISGIVERGAKFSKKDYVAILRLLHRSDNDSTDELVQRQISKLNFAMKGTGIAV